jgi:RNA-directed DNA polymerase
VLSVRPRRGAQEALDEVDRVICRESTSCVLGLDITSYFVFIVRERLMEMIKRRISDASILRLTEVDQNKSHRRRKVAGEQDGTGKGQIVSPLLANVYLHFVFDQWIESDVKPCLRGKCL